MKQVRQIKYDIEEGRGREREKNRERDGLDFKLPKA